MILQRCFILEINDVTIGILAGGKATRMNNKDKGLVYINGKTLVKNIIDKISPYTNNILINANRNIETYKNYNYPVVTDEYKDYQGPLSGILSMLKNISSEYLLTIPCDSPNISWKLINKFLIDSNNNHDIFVAHNNLRSQPVFMLLSKRLIDSLDNFLISGQRKIDIWYKENNFKYIYFDKEDNYFDNINTIDQLNKYNNVK